VLGESSTRELSFKKKTKKQQASLSKAESIYFSDKELHLKFHSSSNMLSVAEM